MNYFNTSRLALSCAFGLMVWAQMQTGAFAQKAPVDFGDSILSVPLPAPKLANAEIGELRGLIYQDHLDKVHLDKVQRDEVHRDGENRSNVAHTQSFEHSSLSNPGLVHHAEPGIQIDRIVTGTPFRYNSTHASKTTTRYGLPIKFDSSGQPMAHHQEYPRPTALSVVTSLMEAINLNPYPGDY